MTDRKLTCSDFPRIDCCSLAEFETAFRQADARAAGFASVPEHQDAQRRAFELAGRGASVQEVVSATHLPEGEARLITEMVRADNPDDVVRLVLDGLDTNPTEES